jgi:putative peptidoglycan lipid II flippase
VIKNKFIRETISTTIFSVIGKGVGFIIPFFVAASFGVSAETDAFFYAYGVILFFGGIVAPTIENAIVPYIAEIREDRKAVGQFLGQIILISGLFISLLMIGIALFSIPILGSITNFDHNSLKLIEKILWEISSLGVLLMITSVLGGTLNTYKLFAENAISPAVRAVVTLIFIFLFRESLGIHAVGLGYVVGEIARCAWLSYFVVNKFNVVPVPRFSGPNVKKFFFGTIQMVIGLTALNMTTLIDQTMASWLDAGSVSKLFFADRLYVVLTTMVSAGVLVTILSYWASIPNDEREMLTRKVDEAIKVLFLLSVGSVIILILFNRSLVDLFFFQSDISKEVLDEIALIWVGYLVGFVPYLLARVYVRALLVVNETKVIMYGGVFKSVIKIAINFAVFPFFGLLGLAVSTSLMSGFEFLYFRFKFKKLVALPTRSSE